MNEVEQAREKLLKGVRSFTAEVFPERREAYERLMRDGQKPHTLFITCADSRIEPTVLTQSQPGEIFVSRNIGNVVPAYGEMLGGISAVIEYAVVALEVKQVVICGHSDCGATRALLDPERVAQMPTVKSWLRNSEAALSVTQALHPDHAQSDAPNDLIRTLIEQNVLLQMNHLRTHPSVAGRLAQGKLSISGWVYDIAEGHVAVYNEAEGKFAVDLGSRE